MSSLLQKKSEILAAFECKNSGNCCRAEGVVVASPQEVEKMAALLKLDIVTFLNRYTKRKNGWTVIADKGFRQNCFLDHCNKCSIYEARPSACRTYPNWDYIWESEASLYKESSQCRGLQCAIEKVQNG
jgi:hypothetical protein